MSSRAACETTSRLDHLAYIIFLFYEELCRNLKTRARNGALLLAEECVRGGFFSEYAWWGSRVSNEKGGKRFVVCRGKIRATSSRLDTAENAEECIGEEIEGKMWLRNWIHAQLCFPHDP